MFLYSWVYQLDICLVTEKRNLSNDEFIALQNLSEYKRLILQKSTRLQDYIKN